MNLIPIYSDPISPFPDGLFLRTEWRGGAYLPPPYFTVIVGDFYNFSDRNLGLDVKVQNPKKQKV